MLIMGIITFIAILSSASEYPRVPHYFKKGEEVCRVAPELGPTDMLCYPLPPLTDAEQ